MSEAEKDLLQRISRFVIWGIPDEDHEALSELHVILLSQISNVVKIEAYKRVCEANWEEVNLETVEQDMFDYVEALRTVFEHSR